MTKREIFGRSLLTLSIALSLIAGIVFDWTVSHYVDPDWAAHARFHVLTYHGTRYPTQPSFISKRINRIIQGRLDCLQTYGSHSDAQSQEGSSDERPRTDANLIGEVL